MTATATRPPGTPGPASEGDDARTDWVAAIPFFLVHLAPLAAFFVDVTWQDWVLCAVLYFTRMFCITAGYHRYFSHRSFKTNRVFQFILAWWAECSVQTAAVSMRAAVWSWPLPDSLDRFGLQIRAMSCFVGQDAK